MYLRYSFSVLRQWPAVRRREGRLQHVACVDGALEAPPPTSVCSSSMNSTISPFDSSISLSTAFRRSSNSRETSRPPAWSPDRARSRACLSGFPARRRTQCAAPDLPRWPSCPRPLANQTQDCFRPPLSTWITRRISSSRPITVQLAAPREFREVLGVFLSPELALGILIRHTLRSRTAVKAFKIASCARRPPPSPPRASPFKCATPNSKCSVERNSSLKFCASLKASQRLVNALLRPGWLAEPATRGSFPRSGATRFPAVPSGHRSFPAPRESRPRDPPPAPATVHRLHLGLPSSVARAWPAHSLLRLHGKFSQRIAIKISS